MRYFVGLDISVRETSVCVVDTDGTIVREAKVTSEPGAIISTLTNPRLAYHRIGLEAGPLSQWLYAALTEAGLPAICVETRHMQAALSAQANKTDRNDARGIAQMMRVGLFKPVHVKSPDNQIRRLLLTSRKLLQRKVLDMDNDLRGTLRNFGLKVGVVGAARFEQRVRELVSDNPLIAAIIVPVLKARAAMREQLDVLHRKLLELVRRDPVCRRLMTAPGVGPVVALTYRAAVDNPNRFRKSQSVGAHFGLTPKTYQSGETHRTGGISRAGDALLRASLYEAALVILTGRTRWNRLKAWGLSVARRRGKQRAMVAVARRLAVILHSMWRDGTDFQWSTEPTKS